MLQAQSRRAQKVLGLRDETLNEIASIFVLIAGLIVLLSLASNSEDGNLIGRLGGGISSALTFVFGNVVAYAVPILTLIWGVAIWCGYRFEQVPLRVVGLFLTATCVCALVALPYAETDFSKQEGFHAGGAIGNFIMHRECLYVKGYLGVAGSCLLFGGIILVSVILVTDAMLRPVLKRMVCWLSCLHPRNWIHTLAIWKYLPRRPKPTSEFGRTLHLVTEEDVPLAPRAPSRPPTPSAVPMPRTGSHERSGPSTSFVQEARELASRPLTEQSAVLDAMETEALTRRRATPSPVINVAPPPRPDCDDLVSLAEAASEAAPVQQELTLFKEYEKPGLELLNLPPKLEHRMNKEEILNLSDTLERTLSEFGITAQVVQVTQGPTVTRFEIQPAPGIKVSRIASLENDITMCMKAESVRIIAPIPGKGAVGLEIPNSKPTPVVLREILNTDAFRNHPSPLAFALGKTIGGEPYICDLAAMPHLLIAGTTGSGKSVCLNSIICSILFRMNPDHVRFIMIDPKRVELNVYQAIPHLLAPVVSEPRKAAAAITWAIEQMEERYKKLASLGVRNIDGYNAVVCSNEPHPKAMGRRLEYMPHIVIVVDELADLMLIARNEVEDNIIRLAQMSRAVGMHLIIATQRPSVNVITGIIKANFPSRVAFQVSSKVDSRTILDANGAEALIGRGDMLFSPGGLPKPIRLQGCYVSDQEVERCAEYVRSQQQARYLKQDFAAQRDGGPEPGLTLDGIDADDSRVPMPPDDDAEDEPEDYPYTYRQQEDGSYVAVPKSSGRSTQAEDGEAIDEELFRRAVRLILTHRKASVSLLQRKLKIGFARAGRVMDMIEEAGVVGPNCGSKVREITVDPDEYLARMDAEDDNKFTT